VKIGVYPGSFDPITNGHIDIIERALDIFDEVYITVALNPSKKHFFSLEERVNMIQSATKAFSAVKVFSYNGLIVDFVKKHQAIAIIRGIRALSDFEYEFQMALMNRKMAPDVETVFLMPREEYSYLNSSLVKELARFNAPLSCLVPSIVSQKLKEKYQANDSFIS